MLEPRLVHEQMKHDYFSADRMIVVYYSQQYYDAVLRENPITGREVPFYDEIDNAYEGTLALKAAVDKYKISDED